MGSRRSEAQKQKRLYDVLETISEHTAHLQRKLAEVETAQTNESAQLSQKLSRAVECYFGVNGLGGKNTKFKELDDEARKLCREAPSLVSGGDITAVENALSDLRDAWGSLKSASASLADDNAGAVPPAVESARNTLLAVVATRALVVARVARALEDRLVGQGIAFDDVFGTDFAGADERKRVIAVVQSEEGAMSGVIDPSSGTIYKISTNRAVQLLCAVLPAAFAVGAGALLYVVSKGDNWFSFGSWNKISSWHDLLGTYLLVLGGALLHLVIERTKRLQDGLAANIIVAGETLRWLNLRWFQISLSLVYVLATTIGLEVASQDQWLTALAAGYAVDSVGGLFISRFTDLTGTKVAAVKAALTAGSGSAPAAPS